MNNARALSDRRVFNMRSAVDQRFLARRSAISLARQRACAGKVRFPSKRSATGRARALSHNVPLKPDQGEWHGYRCSVCRHWHVGHSRPWTP